MTTRGVSGQPARPSTRSSSRSAREPLQRFGSRTATAWTLGLPSKSSTCSSYLRQPKQDPMKCVCDAEFVWDGHRTACSRQCLHGVETICRGATTCAAAPQDPAVHEVAVMRQLQHDNILPVLSFWREDEHMWLVTPYCSGGSVADILQV